ncbi:MAG: histidine phosphatase family protein [Pseudomonadota bacterium]
MKRSLILMRHAKSSWNNPMLDDHDRPLNGRGQANARALGRWLRDTNCLPDLALVSTALRTRQTYDHLSFQAEPVLLPSLYHAEDASLLNVLREQTAGCILLIGHNPGIAELAHHLAGSPQDHPRFSDYPTGATTKFDIDGTWGDLDQTTADIIDFVVPADLATDAPTP